MIRSAAAAFLFMTAQAVAAEPHAWSYDHPAEWGGACATGREQSPIDLTGIEAARLDALRVDYRTQALAVENNGHTLEVAAAPGSTVEIAGQRYELAQFHFHHPAEHAVGGAIAPMELHLVHKGPTPDSLAVVGVMLVPGAAHPTIEAIWTAAPGATIDPNSLLPAERDYVRYEGSLTTPPCSEVVRWIVLKNPIEVSQDQIDRFATLFPGNARPLQPRHRRVLLEQAGQ